MLSPWFLPLVAALFGAVIGSFLNVVILRLPAGGSLAYPGSHCPRCGAPIRARDNVPVLGWIALGGRCRDCRGPISPRYPLVEAANALLWAALALRFGLGAPLFVNAAFCSALLAITLIDVDHWIIPDAITLPGIVVGLATSFLAPPRDSLLADYLHHRLRLGRLPAPLDSAMFWDSVAAAAAGYAFFWLAAEIGDRVFHKESMGGGDLKLTAMMGAFLGVRDLSVAVFVALLAGSAVGLALIAAGRKSRGDALPFGPFLALGGTCAVFWGRPLVDWYLALHGL